MYVKTRLGDRWIPESHLFGGVLRTPEYYLRIYDKHIDCQELCVGRRLAGENLLTKGFDVRLGRDWTHKTGSQTVL